MAGAAITNVKAIMSASGNWHKDENGELIVKKVTAETGEFGKLKVGAQESPQGITIYDPSGNPYCAGVEIGGVVNSKSGTCGTESPPEQNPREYEREDTFS